MVCKLNNISPLFNFYKTGNVFTIEVGKTYEVTGEGNFIPTDIDINNQSQKYVNELLLQFFNCLQYRIQAVGYMWSKIKSKKKKEDVYEVGALRRLTPSKFLGAGNFPPKVVYDLIVETVEASTTPWHR